MQAPNLIHGLTFDLTYDGLEHTGESLADWLRETLLPVLDETLAQHDQPQQVCRIEHLEIDLGEILLEEVEGELALRLHQRLVAALNWRSAPAAIGPGGEPAQGDAENLLRFLGSGRLPWSVAVDQQIAHEQLLQRVLALPEAKAVLGKATQDNQMLTRLARQFAPATLSQIVLLLHGVHTEFSNPSEADLLSLLSEGHARSVANASPAERPAAGTAQLERIPAGPAPEDVARRAAHADAFMVEQAAANSTRPQRALQYVDSAQGTMRRADEHAQQDRAPAEIQTDLAGPLAGDSGRLTAATGAGPVWADADYGLRQKLATQWREMPYQTLQGYLSALAQSLTATQFNDLLALIDPTSARQGGTELDRTGLELPQSDRHLSSAEVDRLAIRRALQGGDIARIAEPWNATGHAHALPVEPTEASFAPPISREEAALGSLAQILAPLHLQDSDIAHLEEILARRTAEGAQPGHVPAEIQSDLAILLAGVVGMVEQPLSEADPVALKRMWHESLELLAQSDRHLSDAEVDRSIIRRVLQDGDVSQIAELWTAIGHAHDLPVEPAEASLAPPSSREEAALGKTASAPHGGLGTAHAGVDILPVKGKLTRRTDEDAHLKPEQEKRASQLSNISGMVDHRLRESDLVALKHFWLGTRKTLPQSDRNASDAEVDRLAISRSATPTSPEEAVLAKTESAQLGSAGAANASVDGVPEAPAGSAIDLGRRHDFKLQWRGLAAQRQQDYLNALAQALTAEQYDELVACVGPLKSVSPGTVDVGAPEDTPAGIALQQQPIQGGSDRPALPQGDVEILTQPAAGVTHPLSTADAALSRVDPALAMFRDWQRYKLDLPNITLTLPELKQWLNWWLMHDPRLVNQDCSLMLEAIDTQCAQLEDAVEFMKLVLTTLREDQALDLDALLVQATSQPVQVDKPLAMDAIGTLRSQQAIRNFVEQQMAEDDQLSGLNSAQLHQLVRAWIGDAPSLFLAAVEDQALFTQDIHWYFRSILQSLLIGRPVDLECLVTADVPVAATVALTQQPLTQELSPVGPSPLPLLLQQGLPQKLAEALLHADLAPLRVIWPEVLRFHAGVLMAAARRYLRRPQERARLVAQGDWDMVTAMLGALSPETGRQIEPLVQHAAACNAILPAPLAVEDFRRRLLGFGLERILGDGEGGWLAGVMRALDVGSERADDVAHAWRAILPPGRSQSSIPASPMVSAAAQAQACGGVRASALDCALFGDAPDQVDVGLAAAPCAAVAGSEASLAVLLMRSGALTEVEQQVAGLLVERLLGMEGETLSGALESALCQPAAIARLIKITPGPVLAQLLLLLQPALAAQLPAALRAIAGAAVAAGSGGAEAAAGSVAVASDDAGAAGFAGPVALANVPAMQTREVWGAIYQAGFMAADPVTPVEFIRHLVHSVSGRTDARLPQPVPVLARAETLKLLFQPMAAIEPEAAPQPLEPAWSGESHIGNAGMVIFATYMQRLFGILELTSDGKFVSDDAAQRAVHLVQYAVTGEVTTPEYQLVLNKLFCGIHGGQPIARGIEITPKEKDTIEQMLNGVIAHWSALGKTSLAGLRQTFLQREGHLYFEEEAWRLKIPQATFDMLLDRLPWSFSMIKFPWMEYPLHVTWR
ncbi:hypothetical protein GTP56_05965 [Duganella sp. FT134W]|uniref:Uncharacterized protein n=1 Tax=Duganella margarita TaxID=2692170 RepID=A0A7X4GY06_9BURK|nr:contractile injection system tape measure protein [Duganella margarita]MYM71743.1 hypothetical protein [Duganella margarita]